MRKRLAKIRSFCALENLCPNGWVGWWWVLGILPESGQIVQAILLIKNETLGTDNRHLIRHRHQIFYFDRHRHRHQHRLLKFIDTGTGIEIDFSTGTGTGTKIKN